MSTANRRLTDQQPASHASSRPIVVLPDGAKVDVDPSQDASQPTKVAIDGATVAAYRTLPRSIALVISAIDTPHQNSATHIPKFPLIEVLPPSEIQDGARATITPADLWGVLNVFHTIYHVQETIPIVFAPSLQNAPELTNYLLLSGLGRKRHTTPGDAAALAQAHAVSELFLLRETFWQGAGTAASFHTRGGWLRGHAALLAAAPFPHVQSFTRTDLVIAAHPLRPPKPRPGEVVYRKYFPSIGQSLEFAYFDATGEAVGTEPAADAGGAPVSRHLATFHRWHNSDHVNRGWGERGPLEKHRNYMEQLLADPGVLPVMMSWDGELMGYAELVYLKVWGAVRLCLLWVHPSAPKNHRENHAGPYVPGGVWDYDRGLHILVGEEKFRGLHRSRAWLSSIHHFLFLSDPRTLRAIGEPKQANTAVISLSVAVGMNVETWFDFPYKRSVMTWLPRERWFKLDILAFAEDLDTPAAKL
ncbi:acyl-CoA N-acyltransferase [Ganoderma leucocontextum]|nr:acyl-CoA N-acyltransferase [Ganoderma leucocontextum]